ncbi:MAG: polysaccharide biosynthesis C-terminal domain-containing protein [Flavisolibacter sp.]
MSSIRRQSIISSIVVYFGFAVGLFNTYLFTREGGFTEQQYGLTNTFIAIASSMFSVAGMAMPSFISKFFPYYQAHLPQKKNDQLSWALLVACIGFLVVVVLGIFFKHILIDKIFSNSPELPEYYYWTFLFGFGYTLFMVMEAYAWQHRKAVLSNFLKEVIFRGCVTVLIVLTTLGIIKDFNGFITLYSFIYLGLVIFLIYFFFSKGQLHFTFSVSKVTKRFYRKIITLVTYFWGGGLVFNLANVFDGIVIAAVLPNGMAAAGIFYLAQNVSSLMQAPQRAMISAAVGPLSQAWKDKDYKKIDTIYHRSSINQLIFASAMFCLIWLNFEDGVHSFHLRETYLQAQWIFFFIGISRIIDMGTGLNSHIIGTSTFWRFDFVSGLILLSLALPLNWQLTRYLGLIGPAVSSIISLSIYNFIRCWFLWRKFRMQPFTMKSLYTVIVAAVSYLIVWFAFGSQHGFLWMVVRSVVFCLLFGTGMFGLRLSPDIQPVLATIKKRLGIKV